MRSSTPARSTAGHGPTATPARWPPGARRGSVSAQAARQPRHAHPATAGALASCEAPCSGPCWRCPRPHPSTSSGRERGPWPWGAIAATWSPSTRTSCVSASWIRSPRRVASTEMATSSAYLDSIWRDLWAKEIFTFIPDRDLPPPPDTVTPGPGPRVAFAGFPSDFSLAFLLRLLQLDVQPVGIITSPGAHPAILGDNALSRIADHRGVPL